MVRKIAILIVLGILAGLGWSWYSAYRTAPERTADGFVRHLSNGEADKAYAYLSKNLTHSREQYWHEYLSHFKSPSGQEPRLIRKEYVADTFDTYSEENSPYRLVYTLQRDGNEYQMGLVVIKQNGNWRIDNIYGSELQ